MSELLGKGETAAQFLSQMRPLLEDLLSVASDYSASEDRRVLSLQIDGPEPGYLIAVRGVDGPLPTLAAHIHTEIQRVYRGVLSPTGGAHFDLPTSGREELLQMMALALQVASGIIARKELPDPVDMTTLKEATFESYALILQGMPGIFRQVNAADRREFLETTLLQLRLEQERDLLEQMIEVKGND